MEEARQEKLKISNDLLDAMLVGVKTGGRFMGQRGHHHPGTMPISNWSKALSHFYVRYVDRFPKVA